MIQNLRRDFPSSVARLKLGLSGPVAKAKLMRAPLGECLNMVGWLA